MRTLISFFLLLFCIAFQSQEKLNSQKFIGKTEHINFECENNTCLNESLNFKKILKGSELKYYYNDNNILTLEGDNLNYVNILFDKKFFIILQFDTTNNVNKHAASVCNLRYNGIWIIDPVSSEVFHAKLDDMKVCTDYRESELKGYSKNYFIQEIDSISKKVFFRYILDDSVLPIALVSRN